MLTVVFEGLREDNINSDLWLSSFYKSKKCITNTMTCQDAINIWTMMNSSYWYIDDFFETIMYDIINDTDYDILNLWIHDHCEELSQSSLNIPLINLIPQWFDNIIVVYDIHTSNMYLVSQNEINTFARNVFNIPINNIHLDTDMDPLNSGYEWVAAFNRTNLSTNGFIWRD